MRLIKARPFKHLKHDGFTLIELTIALVIIGLILTGISSALLTMQKQAKMRAAQHKYETIREALHLYYNANGKLPCPASLSAAPDSDTFAKEVTLQCTVGVFAGTTRANGTDGRQVRIGTIPTRSMNIPDEYMVDPWGSRILYAVTEIAASPGGFDPNLGAISIVDTNNNSLITPANTAHYVIVGFGADRIGAHTLSGTQPRPCTAGTSQAENCDNDSTFRGTILLSDAAGREYDDYIAYEILGQNNLPLIPTNAVMAFNSSVCPLGWTPLAEAVGRVIVGSGSFDQTYSPTDRPSWSYNHVYAVGETGGYATIRQKAAEIPTGPTATGSGGMGVSASGTADPVENRPPYLSLTYCQKV